MRNTKSIIAAIIIAIFTLTSCQKESISELSQDVTSTQNRTTPETNTVNTAIKTQFTERMKKTMATSRSRNNETLSCMDGPIIGNTANSDNYFDAINSPCLDGNGDFFDGPDKSYTFLVTDSPGENLRLSIILTKMQQDLDLFVFSLDNQGRTGECVATSITHGLEDEVLEVGDLAQGYYIVVVDGWNKNIQSTFELITYCSSSQEVPESFAKTLVNKVIIGEIGMAEEATIFQQISTTKWMITGTESGIADTITEISRDNQNIYLKFDSSSEEFQLDLRNKKILINGSEISVEYAHILDTSAEMNGYLANIITLGKDGQSVGKLHRQFDITENKEIWANSDDTFYTLSNEENNIFMITPEGFGILQFDLVKMKVFIEQDNQQVAIFDILSFE